MKDSLKGPDYLWVNISNLLSMSSSKKAPDESWNTVSGQEIYRREYGMVYGDYLLERNLVVNLYKEGKINLKEMLFRWKRDVRPHKRAYKDLMESCL